MSFTDSAHDDESVGSYSYDADGQLTGATPGNGQAPNASNSLTNASYDDNGNAASVNGGTTTIGQGNTLLSDGKFNYQHDADGNVILRTRISTASADDYQTLYTWDNRNRLTGITFKDNSGTVTSEIHYTYDLFNNLIGRTYTTYELDGVTVAATSTQRYVFDGTKMVLAFNGNGNLTDRFLWGPAVDQVLADEQFSGNSQLPTAHGNSLWSLGDNQNSVRDLVDDSGTLQEHIAYSPFGQQVAAQSSNPGYVTFAFGYTGTYTDPVTGYQLHGVRWYDPTVGRWLSEDPSGLGPDMNPYRYCGNGPTDGTDLGGLAIIYSSEAQGGVATFGVGGTVSIWIVSVSFSGGLVFGNYGQVGTYQTFGLGGGPGVGGMAGGVVGASNAKDICDLSGPFADVNVGAAFGPGLGVDGYYGSSPNGPVYGGQVLVAGGGAIGESQGGTYIFVQKIEGPDIHPDCDNPRNSYWWNMPTARPPDSGRGLIRPMRAKYGFFCSRASSNRPEVGMLENCS